ncbi:citryl-CoA lyase [Leucobacter denitrificans]|uniref:citrate synthase (unknown stereospecificity) n=1 Tax=Leucobacter denitrificans TaxID=683042 RepID=A0A7G9S289_9MICO|nr:citryl-CoA lyase [Leucobacter denitrificans]QNN61964.1 citryl-CoA lyase [Leucobacter denitrificans]
MTNEQAAEQKYWKTGISRIEPEHIYIRGYDLEQLIGLPFAATTFLQLRGRLPSPGEARVVDSILTSILDYGLEKAGTAAARFIVSSNPNMQAGLATAILGAGEHSVAPENAARFIQEQYSAFEESGSADMAEFAAGVVADASAKRYRIPGFGHPVFRGEDPRAQKLKRIAVEAGIWEGPAKLYEAIHAEFVKNPKVAHFPINDVGMLAALCVAMEFTPEEATALAVIGTLPGVAAHITEEITSGRLVRQVQRSEAKYDVPELDLQADMAAAGWDVDTTQSGS